MTPIQALYTAVLAGLRAGLTPEQIKAAILSAAEVKP